MTDSWQPEPSPWLSTPPSRALPPSAADSTPTHVTAEYVTHEPTPTYVTHEPTPTYVTHEPMPAYVTHEPSPAYVTHDPAPTYVTHEPAPTYVSYEPPLPPPPSSVPQEPTPYRAAPQPYAPSPLDDPHDPMATQLVAVGTVQPREQRPTAGSVDEAEQILADAIEAVDADPSLYSIGGVTEGAVCLVPEDGRWSVFLAEYGSRRYNGTFDDPEHAAVHFAGVLLLVANERGKLPSNLPATTASSTVAPAPTSSRVDPFTDFLAGPPIEPMAGDPPMSLYAERRLTVLPPGTELDRFGDQEGNTLYAARTRYPNRSLPPDFVNREYRVYRLHDPLRAVTGSAVPWFGQPGGGTVYLLPASIRDLMNRGILTEIPAATVIPY